MKIHEMLIIVVVLIIMPSLISVPVYGDNNADIKNRVAKLYFSTVKKVLKEDFWNPRDVADMSEVLLIPMDFAFRTKNVEMVQDFEQSFQRFIKENGEKELDKQSDLVKMQFYYILSEFLVLAGTDFSNYKFDTELKKQLFSIIKMKFQKFWISPTKVWDVCVVNDFNNGQFEMISWQLETVFPKKSYCTAIMDDSKFAIGIAANLYNTLGQIKIPITIKDQEDILVAIRLGDRIFSEQISFIGNKGAWLFQPGVWWDHPDYWWSGYDKAESNLKPKPSRGVGIDTSHSFKLPLLLRSLFRASTESQTRNHYKKLIDGLSIQLLTMVVVQPDAVFSNYRTNNFMNGENGLYRYSYNTVSGNGGYEPFELSGSLLFGWWSLLNNKQIRDMYCKISATFPLKNNEISLYLGPDTTRVRHPMLSSRNQFSSGILELLVSMACINAR